MSLRKSLLFPFVVSKLFLWYDRIISQPSKALFIQEDTSLENQIVPTILLFAFYTDKAANTILP